MAVSVTMPRLGESVSEGTVTRWLKKEGDHVEADEPLLEVSTDKVDTEIPAPASGTLTKIAVQEDETVEVGVELAVIGEGADGDQSGGDAGGQDGEADTAQEAGGQEEDGQEASGQEADGAGAGAQRDETDQSPGAPSAAGTAPERTEPEGTAPEDTGPAPTASEQGEPEPTPEPAAPQRVPAQPAAAPGAQRTASPSRPEQQAPAAGGDGADGSGGAYVTPLVRKLAAEQGIDLAGVRGTGVGGRIRKQDVLDAVRGDAGGGARPAQPAAASPSPRAAQPAGSAATKAAPTAQVRGRTEKLSRLRHVIATRMVESLQTSAQLTTVVEADVTAIARLRQRAKSEFEAREGVKLSFLPFFALAAVEALKAHPRVNSSIDLDAGTVTYHDAEHLGIAVDTDRGLLVPVIHDAGDLNLGGLARKISDLAERTRGNNVTPDELGGGTFTLTNTGSRGALFDTPILNQPQVGILGTGTVVKRPVVVDDPDLGEVIAVRSVVYLALTYDHRIVDGADAARFLLTVKDRLEAGDFAADLGL